MYGWPQWNGYYYGIGPRNMLNNMGQIPGAGVAPGNLQQSLLGHWNSAMQQGFVAVPQTPLMPTQPLIPHNLPKQSVPFQQQKQQQREGNWSRWSNIVPNQKTPSRDTPTNALNSGNVATSTHEETITVQTTNKGIEPVIASNSKNDAVKLDTEEATKELAPKTIQEKERLDSLKEQAKNWQQLQKKQQEQQQHWDQHLQMQQTQMYPPIQLQHMTFAQPNVSAVLEPAPTAGFFHNQQINMMNVMPFQAVPAVTSPVPLTQLKESTLQPAVSASPSLVQEKQSNVEGLDSLSTSASYLVDNSVINLNVDTKGNQALELLVKCLREFDDQLKQWNEQFDEWRRQNKDHPDKEKYFKFEKQWLDWRTHLLERHLQMKQLYMQQVDLNKLSDKADSNKEGKNLVGNHQNNFERTTITENAEYRSKDFSSGDRLAFSGHNLNKSRDPNYVDKELETAKTSSESFSKVEKNSSTPSDDSGNEPYDPFQDDFSVDVSKSDEVGAVWFNDAIKEKELKALEVIPNEKQQNIVDKQPFANEKQSLVPTFGGDKQQLLGLKMSLLPKPFVDEKKSMGPTFDGDKQQFSGLKQALLPNPPLLAIPPNQSNPNFQMFHSFQQESFSEHVEKPKLDVNFYYEDIKDDLLDGRKYYQFHDDCFVFMDEIKVYEPRDEPLEPHYQRRKEKESTPGARSFDKSHRDRENKKIENKLKARKSGCESRFESRQTKLKESRYDFRDRRSSSSEIEILSPKADLIKDVPKRKEPKVELFSRRRNISRFEPIDEVVEIPRRNEVAVDGNWKTFPSVNLVIDDSSSKWMPASETIDKAVDIPRRNEIAVDGKWTTFPSGNLVIDDSNSSNWMQVSEAIDKVGEIPRRNEVAVDGKWKPVPPANLVIDDSSNKWTPVSEAINKKTPTIPLAVGGSITRTLTEEEQLIIKQTAEDLKALQDLKELTKIFGGSLSSKATPSTTERGYSSGRKSLSDDPFSSVMPTRSIEDFSSLTSATQSPFSCSSQHDDRVRHSDSVEVKARKFVMSSVVSFDYEHKSTATAPTEVSVGETLPQQPTSVRIPNQTFRITKMESLDYAHGENISPLVQIIDKPIEDLFRHTVQHPIIFPDPVKATNECRPVEEVYESPYIDRDKMVPRWDSPKIDRLPNRIEDDDSYSRDHRVSLSKSGTVVISDILSTEGRKARSPRIVIILRGPPGSSKTYVAKLIKDKEIENGGCAPRILSLDDYFMVEVERVGIDPETGKPVKLKVLEYEYEAEVEESYRRSLFKSFKKTVDDGFFPLIIVDAINNRCKHFDEMCSYARQKGFKVYICEMDMDPITCYKRNIHNRSLDEITKMINKWEDTPRHYVQLDVRSLIQDASIPEVEMEDFSTAESSKGAECSKVDKPSLSTIVSIDDEVSGGRNSPDLVSALFYFIFSLFRRRMTLR
ncbi:hypothetical protein CHUAL_008292 [Chamberlinius hualienensis]